MTFARTKIQPPRPRPGSLIERPALERRLGEALLTRRLVLVHAAAGFGKTSALARQLERLPAGTAPAWVACDAGDTPADLFECLVAALEPFDPPWRSAPEALVRAAVEIGDAQARRAIAAEVINALDACDVEHGVIVLDDLHRIEHAAVFEFLDDLLERFTPRWTLAIATRQMPPLAFARLRALDEVAEFGLEDLRFDRDEAHRMAAAAGLGDDAAERLYARAHGWPVGLRLGLNAWRGGAAAGRGPAIDRHVFDFLASEVIDRLPPPLREFLLSTSVLPELTAARCAALSGDSQAAAWLDEVDRRGLFVTPLAEAEPTWRLHDLFREALETRFAREQPQRHREALRRAAASEGDALRRVGWLQRAQDWDAAEAALSEASDDLIAGGSAAALRAAFDGFPLQHRHLSARLKLLLARMQWDWDSAISATAAAADAFAAEGRDAERQQALSYHCLALGGANRHEGARAAAAALLAEPGLDRQVLARTLCAVAWVELARGDQRTLAPMWTRLLAALEPGDRLSQWLACAPLGPFVGLPGMRQPLQAFVEHALQRVPDHPTPLRGTTLVMQAWLALWRGDVDGAEAHATAAAEDTRWLAQAVSLDSPTRSIQAVLRALRGDAAGALGGLRALVAQIEASAVPLRTEVYRCLYLYLGMRCAALLDDRDALSDFAARLAAEPEAGRAWMSPRQRSGAAAHLAALAGDSARAIALWREMLADEHHVDLYGQLADTRLRLAAALLAAGDADAAAAALLPLFERCEADGEWGVALLAGPALLAQLDRAPAWQGRLPAAALARLRDWAGRSRQLAGPAPASEATATGSPLSQRESEVLACMAAGDSNKLIARALDLSPHTVKRHVANILDKLGLQSRAQAAAWHAAQR